ncbi:unnamed protein product [Darwinula stevensoni]|uniref:Uncharacterized protein n=1 Tax=Darwinula stevensoni TaxID=69355 RepID=A0A7R9ADX1_9CRUS|nr:unnamed protein product [Darwinula stevensoni]CAG0901456.1 unnamed protein product [Darwinula stevensoni]
MRLKGEVPAVSKEKSEEILKVLKQSGVEWHEGYPPVALKTRTGSGAAGFLETMSLLLTGSLLHLPLLKKLCGAELKDDKDSDLLGKNEKVRKYILTSRREAERRMNLHMRVPATGENVRVKVTRTKHQRSKAKLRLPTSGPSQEVVSIWSVFSLAQIKSGCYNFVERAIPMEMQRKKRRVLSGRIPDAGGEGGSDATAENRRVRCDGRETAGREQSCPNRGPAKQRSRGETEDDCPANRTSFCDADCKAGMLDPILKCSYDCTCKPIQKE